MSKLALLLDFDGTVTETDVGARMIREFGAEGWDRGIARFRTGEFGVRELLEWETAHLPSAQRREMTEFAVGIATIRPGFRELVDFATDREIPVEIVSNGWDFYIRAVLQRNGFSDLEFNSPVAFFGSERFAELRFGAGVEVCSTTGLCKCERVRMQRKRGRTVIYAGDGISDFCVAGEADAVMARGELAKYCQEQCIPYVEYEDMFDVLARMEALLGKAEAAASFPT